MSLGHYNRRIEAVLAHEVELIHFDPVEAVRKIGEGIRRQLAEVLHRRGVVVGVGGGVDSAVCAGLAVEAIGRRRVFGLIVRERECDDERLRLASTWVEQLGIDSAIEDVTAVLEQCGCYARRDDVVQRLVSGYEPGWHCETVPRANDISDRVNPFRLRLRGPDGVEQQLRLTPAEYRQVVAATRMKQRVRKNLEYYHAERLHYAVIGTQNRDEQELGIFVRGGDDLADIKPILHLDKTRVCQLARYLGVPAAIIDNALGDEEYALAGDHSFSSESRSFDP